MYDPQLNDTHVVDPEVENGQESMSPYAFGFDNAVRYNDPDGRCPDCPLPEPSALDQLGATTAATVTALAEGVGAVVGGVSALTLAGATALAAAAVGAGAVLANPGLYGTTRPAYMTGQPDGPGKGYRRAEAPTTSAKTENGTVEAVPGSRRGREFTPKEKAKVIDANAEKNGGKVVCENCKTETTKPQKSQRGVTPPKTDRQVDHKEPKSKGGSGTAENGQVLCRTCNREKSDK